MINPEYEKLLKQIDKLKTEINRLNDACAEKLNQVAGNNTSRILSYAQEEEINKTVDVYTKKIAKLVLDLEELEEVNRLYLDGLKEE